LLVGKEFVCIAYLERSASFEGERYSWDELLLFGEHVGFRWLVRDDTGWFFVEPVNLADLDLRDMPRFVRYMGQRFSERSASVARVDYVLGEVFWKCAVGETVKVSDYVLGNQVLSREEAPGEVRWSYSAKVPWPVLSRAFGVVAEKPSGMKAPSIMGGTNTIVLMVFLVIAFIIVASVLSGGGGGSSYGGGGPVYGGSGYYYGGK
jgi:hypothetical protein